MGKVRHELWIFCKAQMTAQAATAVDFFMSLVLAEVVGIWYVWSSFIGALTGGLVNCSMNYRWVFDSEGLKKRNVVSKYFMVWSGSIILNTIGTYALTELSRQHFIFSKILVSVAIGILWNYQLQRNFVYKETHLKEKIKGIKNK